MRMLRVACNLGSVRRGHPIYRKATMPAPCVRLVVKTIRVEYVPATQLPDRNRGTEGGGATGAVMLASVDASVIFDGSSAEVRALLERALEALPACAPPALIPVPATAEHRARLRCPFGDCAAFDSVAEVDRSVRHNDATVEVGDAGELFVAVSIGESNHEHISWECSRCMGEVRLPPGVEHEED